MPDGALQVAKTAKLMMPVTDPPNSHLCSPQPICQPLCPGVGGGAQSEKTPQGPGRSRKGPSSACPPFARTPVLQRTLPSGHCPAQGRGGVGGGGYLLGTPEPRVGPRLTEPVLPTSPASLPGTPAPARAFMGLSQGPAGMPWRGAPSRTEGETES